MNFTTMTVFLNTLPQKGIPGVDCIIKKGYETIYRYHTGYADREEKIEMKGDELFNLYSATKPITCTAVLQLYEKGKILLNEPVSNYIPEYKNLKVLHRQPNSESYVVPAQKPMTIMQLLTMTSGLDYDLDTPEIRKVVEATDGRAPTMEVARALAAKPLSFEPGEHWQYSLSHDVLGALVEAVSGQNFEDYLRENIFDHCEMKDTTFAFTPKVEKRMMAQYIRNIETGEVTRTESKSRHTLGSEYQSGGGGLISSVNDYSNFVAAMANGGYSHTGKRILSQQTIDFMRANHLTPQQMSDYNWAHLKGYGYGLGVRTHITYAGSDSNSPIGEFGWAGAAGCYLLIDPENKISMFYTQHMLNNMETYVHPRLRSILYSCLE
ncbi:MAG: beta-lactamase family protein [Oscillospiraceae bacterium]|nr:beta-lactamase family protein [Oscillospiraceae bacterium]